MRQNYPGRKISLLVFLLMSSCEGFFWHARDDQDVGWLQGTTSDAIHLQDTVYKAGDCGGHRNTSESEPKDLGEDRVSGCEHRASKEAIYRSVLEANAGSHRQGFPKTNPTAAAVGGISWHGNCSSKNSDCVSSNGWKARTAQGYVAMHKQIRMHEQAQNNLDEGLLRRGTDISGEPVRTAGLLPLYGSFGLHLSRGMLRICFYGRLLNENMQRLGERVCGSMGRKFDNEYNGFPITDSISGDMLHTIMSDWASDGYDSSIERYGVNYTDIRHLDSAEVVVVETGFSMASDMAIFSIAFNSKGLNASLASVQLEDSVLVGQDVNTGRLIYTDSCFTLEAETKKDMDFFKTRHRATKSQRGPKVRWYQWISDVKAFFSGQVLANYESPMGVEDWPHKVVETLCLNKGLQYAWLEPACPERATGRLDGKIGDRTFAFWSGVDGICRLMVWVAGGPYYDSQFYIVDYDNFYISTQNLLTSKVVDDMPGIPKGVLRWVGTDAEWCSGEQKWEFSPNGTGYGCVGQAKLTEKGGCDCSKRDLAVLPPELEYKLVGAACALKLSDSLGGMYIDAYRDINFVGGAISHSIQDSTETFVEALGRVFGNYIIKGELAGGTLITEMRGDVGTTDECKIALDDSYGFHVWHLNECTFMKRDGTVVDVAQYALAAGYRLESTRVSTYALSAERFSGRACAMPVSIGEYVGDYGVYGFGVPACQLCAHHNLDKRFHRYLPDCAYISGATEQRLTTKGVLNARICDLMSYDITYGESNAASGDDCDGEVIEVPSEDGEYGVNVTCYVKCGMEAFEGSRDVVLTDIGSSWVNNYQIVDGHLFVTYDGKQYKTTFSWKTEGTKTVEMDFSGDTLCFDMGRKVLTDTTVCTYNQYVGNMTIGELEELIGSYDIEVTGEMVGTNISACSRVEEEFDNEYLTGYVLLDFKQTCSDAWAGGCKLSNGGFKVMEGWVRYNRPLEDLGRCNKDCSSSVGFVRELNYDGVCIMGLENYRQQAIVVDRESYTASTGMKCQEMIVEAEAVRSSVFSPYFNEPVSDGEGGLVKACITDGLTEIKVTRCEPVYFDECIRYYSYNISFTKYRNLPAVVGNALAKARGCSWGYVTDEVNNVFDLNTSTCDARTIRTLMIIDYEGCTVDYECTPQTTWISSISTVAQTTDSGSSSSEPTLSSTVATTPVPTEPPEPSTSTEQTTTLSTEGSTTRPADNTTSEPMSTTTVGSSTSAGQGSNGSSLEDCMSKHDVFKYSIKTGICTKKLRKSGSDRVSGMGCNKVCTGSELYFDGERESYCVGNRSSVVWAWFGKADGLCSNHKTYRAYENGVIVAKIDAHNYDDFDIVDFYGERFAVPLSRQSFIAYSEHSSALKSKNKIGVLSCTDTILLGCGEKGVGGTMKGVTRKSVQDGLECETRCNNFVLEYSEDGMDVSAISYGNYIGLADGTKIYRTEPEKEAIIDKCSKLRTHVYFCSSGNMTGECVFYEDGGECIFDNEIYSTSRFGSSLPIGASKDRTDPNIQMNSVIVGADYAFTVKELNVSCVTINGMIYYTPHGIFGSLVKDEPIGTMWAQWCILYQSIPVSRVLMSGGKRSEGVKEMMQRLGGKVFNDSYCGGDVVTLTREGDPTTTIGCGWWTPTVWLGNWYDIVSYYRTLLRINGKDLEYNSARDECAATDSVCISARKDEDFGFWIYITGFSLCGFFLLGGCAMLYRLMRLLRAIFRSGESTKLSYHLLNFQLRFSCEEVHVLLRRSVTWDKMYDIVIQGHSPADSLKMKLEKHATDAEKATMVRLCWESMSSLRKVQFWIMYFLPPYHYVVLWVNFLWMIPGMILWTIYVIIHRSNPMKLNEHEETEEEVRDATVVSKLLDDVDGSKYSKVEHVGKRPSAVRRAEVWMKTKVSKPNNNMAAKILLLWFWLFVGPVGALTYNVVTSCDAQICKTSVIFDQVPISVDDPYRRDLVDQNLQTVGYIHVALSELSFTDHGVYEYSVPFSNAVASCSSQSDDDDCSSGNCMTYWGLDDSSDAGKMIVAKCNSLGVSDYSKIQMAYGYATESDGVNGHCAAAAAAAQTWDRVARVYSVDNPVEWSVQLSFSASIMSELFTKVEYISTDQWEYGDPETFQVQLIREIEPSFEMQGQRVACSYPDEHCTFGHEGLLTEDDLQMKYYGEGGSFAKQVGGGVSVNCEDGGTGGDIKCGCTIRNKLVQWTANDWHTRGTEFQNSARCNVKPVLADAANVAQTTSWCRDSSYANQVDCTTNCLRPDCWVTTTPVAPPTLSLIRNGCGGVKFFFNAVFESEYRLGTQDPGIEAKDITITASGCRGKLGQLTLKVTSVAPGKLFLKSGSVIMDWSGHVGTTPVIIAATATLDATILDVQVFTPQTGAKESVIATPEDEIEECETFCEGACDGGNKPTPSDDDEDAEWEWWMYLVIGLGSLAGVVVLIMVILCTINGVARKKTD